MKKLFSLANIALALSVLVTCIWVIWGVPEIFHEGWYAPFEWLYFLLPAAVMLILSLIALRWPRVGAFLYVLFGLVFAAFVLRQFSPGGGRSASWTLTRLLSWMPVTLFLSVVGVLLYLGRERPRRRIHYLAAIGVPLLLGLALTARPAYRVAHRVDDGYRGERFIRGNDVALYWAPAGPGWKIDGGVGWNEIATYGKGDVGFEAKQFGMDGRCNGVDEWETHCATEEDMRAYNVCVFLNREGTLLLPEPQTIWRMPTTDEVVRSLVRNGMNANCEWNGDVGNMPCETKPDKETPLWDPKSRLIYYWTSDEASKGRSSFVVYHGAVVSVPKFQALGSLGYRCVRD